MSTMIKTTLAEQAYQELRSRIVSGQLQGGSRLLPTELAKDLGISPTPIKQACARLEAAGLVVSSTRRGMAVRLFAPSDVEELYAARIMLETSAVERAFQQGSISDELLRGLTDSLEQHRFYARSLSLDGLATALVHDRKFHCLLVAAAGIRMVSEWHERVVGQTHTVFVSIPGNYIQSVADHEDILSYIAARDKAQVLASLERHLGRSRDNTLLQIERLERKNVAE